MSNEFWLGVYLGGSLLTLLYWLVEIETNTSKDNKNRMLLMVFWPLMTLVMVVVSLIQRYKK